MHSRRTKPNLAQRKALIKIKKPFVFKKVGRKETRLDLDAMLFDEGSNSCMCQKCGVGACGFDAGRSRACIKYTRVLLLQFSFSSLTLISWILQHQIGGGSSCVFGTGLHSSPMVLPQLCVIQEPARHQMDTCFDETSVF